MYINLNILEKHGFKWQDNPLLVLQAVKQKDYQLLKDCPKELLNQLYKDGYIQLIEGKPKEDKHLKIRLTDRSKRFLKDCGVKAITEESKLLALKLIELWESNGQTVQNRKKIVELTAWLLGELPEYTVDEIFSCAESYISSSGKFTMGLGNFLWKPENVFQKNWNTSQSKLYSLLTLKQ